MKKSKKLSLQSLALVLMSFILVAGVAFGMTGAWFYHGGVSGNADITMASGVEIELKSANFTVTNAAGTERGAEDKVFPGDKINFTAVVTNKAEAAYIVFKVEADGDLKDLVVLTNLNKGEAQKQAVAKGADATISIPTIELVGKDFTNAHKNKTLTIVVTAYAIQQENYEAGNWNEADSAVFTAEGTFVS